MSFECQVSLCTSCNEHQTYIMEMHDVSCCVWLLWKHAKHPDAVFKLTWLTILGVFTVSVGAWGLLGDIAVKPSSKIALWREPCQIHLHLPQKFFSMLFILGESVCLFQLWNQIFNLSLKQISSTIPFHHIKVKLNMPQCIKHSNHVLWWESPLRPTNSYLLQKQTNKPSRLSLPLHHQQATD